MAANAGKRGIEAGVSEQSVGTDDSGSTVGGLNKLDEAQLHKAADPHDLGLVHSKLDVHRCTSATCPVCSPSARFNKDRSLGSMPSNMGLEADIDSKDEVKLNEDDPLSPDDGIPSVQFVRVTNPKPLGKIMRPSAEL